MAITVDDSGVIFKGANPIIIPRDGNYDTLSILGGFDDNDDIKLASFTSDGKLRVECDLVVDEVKIGAVEIEDRTGGSTLRVDVVPIGGVSSGADNNHGFLSMGVDDSGFTRALPVEDMGSGTFAVPVTLKSNTGDSVEKYNEELSVSAADGETTIVTHSVAAGKIFWMRHATVSGGNVATYRIRTAATLGAILSGSVTAKKRTYFTRFNEDFFFGGDTGQGVKLVGPVVVGVTVQHSRPASGPAASISSTADFNATIYGREEDAL